MMILITGASGFLGQRLVAEALKQGHGVRALVRRPALDLQGDRIAECGGEPNALSALRASRSALHFHQGDITDPATLVAALPGVEAVIHAAATTSETAPDGAVSWRTNVEGTRNLLAACREAGVSRWLQISSLSANPANSSVYGRSKFAADLEVRRSGLRWTILQPGTIYGHGSRGLFAKIVRLTHMLPVVPVLGPGTQLMRPIHVDDVASAALACLRHEATVGQTYALGGGDVVPFNDFLRGIIRARGKRKPLVHIPLWFCFPAARVLSLFLKNPPVTVDNLVGLRQMTAPDITAAQRDFGFAPRTFTEGLQRTFGDPLAGASGCYDSLPARRASEGMAPY